VVVVVVRVAEVSAGVEGGVAGAGDEPGPGGWEGVLARRWMEG
jgi:hypothetical protein